MIDMTDGTPSDYWRFLLRLPCETVDEGANTNCINEYAQGSDGHYETAVAFCASMQSLNIHFTMGTPVMNL
jgi:hypothetical protein